MNIYLRPLRKADLKEYEYWQQPFHAYHKLNGPYFKKQSSEEIAQIIETFSEQFDQGHPNPLFDKMIISDEKDRLIGEVNWYWKSEETNWLEVGVVIFYEKNWGKGIGSIALRLWIDEIFDSRKALVRIGLTTWSGNVGMMRLAEKLGMRKEAEYRNARIVDGKYYDSVSYGILREEWKK